MALKDSIDLIRILQIEQPCSIDWLAGSTGWPREKVARRMFVLAVAGMARDCGSGLYELTGKAAGVVEFFDRCEAHEQ